MTSPSRKEEEGEGGVVEGAGTPAGSASAIRRTRRGGGALRDSPAPSITAIRRLRRRRPRRRRPSRDRTSGSGVPSILSPATSTAFRRTRTRSYAYPYHPTTPPRRPRPRPRRRRRGRRRLRGGGRRGRRYPTCLFRRVNASDGTSGYGGWCTTVTCTGYRRGAGGGCCG